jgi:hypothetical protein
MDIWKYSEVVAPVTKTLLNKAHSGNELASFIGWPRGAFFFDVRALTKERIRSKDDQRMPHAFRHADLFRPRKRGASLLPSSLILEHAEDFIHQGISS